jgi:DNA (cytosine-5)-methyltransferase 1
VYSKIAPTLNARDSHEPRYILEEVKIIGQMDNTLDNSFESANRVYDKNGLCPTIPTCAGGGIQPKILEGEENMSERQNGIKAKKLPNGNIRFYQDDEKKSAISELQVQSGADVAQTITTANVPKIYEEKQIVAMRGRGEHNEQRLEPNTQGVVNALTTVQKDNLLLEKKIQKVGQISSDGSEYGTVISENGLSSNLVAGTHGYANNCILVKQATKEGSIECKVGGCYDASYPDSTTRRGRVQNGGDVTPTITAQGGENINYVETQYRIRKLTPRECWRLMGYSDEDFEKAAEVNSNTQLYKQAGNAIVKQVLMAIFSQLLN